MDLRRLGISEECKGTCAWLLKDSKYCTWMEKFPRLLWIKGKPGTGKSTLMKYALKMEEPKQQPPDYNVASFFFHGRGKPMQQNVLGLFRSLLHQILFQIPHLLSEFQSIFQKKLKTQGNPEKDWNWHEKELQDFFKSNIAEKGYRIRIFIDALDECGEKVAEQLVDYFRGLITSPESALSICFSCRYFPNIGWGKSGEEICIEDGNQHDILTYIRAKLTPAFDNEEEKVEVLEMEILNKASGMFQWVDLVVSKTVNLHQRGKTTKTILNILLEIPTALNELYQAILTTITDEDRLQTLHLMQWVCLAARPLSLKELRFAMASDWPDPLHRPHASHRDLEKSDDFDGDKQMERLLIDLSGGLVEVKHQANESTVQLVHQSVNDFLIQGGLQILDPSDGSPVGRGHHRLSRSCINYATLQEYGYKAAEGDDLIEQFPFLEYAVTSWAWHAERAESENIPQNDLSVRFKWPSSCILQRWIDVHRVIDHGSDEYDEATLLHITSEYGLLSAVEELLLENGIEVDSKSQNGRTPLWYAAGNGHEAVVKLLLDKGVDVDSRDNDGRTPLLWAAENRHEAVVKLLLGKAIEVDSKSQNGRTPLWYAAGNGYVAVVKLLIDKDVDLDSRDFDGRTPLSWAADKGREGVVKLLLDKAVNVDSKDEGYRTPLWWAAESGHDAVVKLLLDNDVEVDSRDKDGRTPLSWAAENGHEAVVRLLLSKGADIDSTDDNGGTPLMYALELGRDNVVELLLSTI
jgi:ankyrin repeat protein